MPDLPLLRRLAAYCMATAISRLTGAVHCAMAGSAPQQHRLHSMFWASQLRCFSLFIAVRAMTNDDLCAAGKKRFWYMYSLYIPLARLEKEQDFLQDAYPSPLDRNPTRAKPRIHRMLPRFFRLTARFRPCGAAGCIRRFVRFRKVHSLSDASGFVIALQIKALLDLVAGATS